MKLSIIIIGALVSSFAGTVTTMAIHAPEPAGRKIYAVPRLSDGGVVLTDLQPGDTAVFSEKYTYNWAYISGAGSSDKKIVVINEGAVKLSAGFVLDNITYLKLTGSGSSSKYGFLIDSGEWWLYNNGVAIDIGGKSAHIEVERVHVNRHGYGCWIKNEGDCDITVQNWILDDISIHDFMMTNINQHGFYAGATEQNNISRSVQCNGVTTYPQPSRLGNIRIYNGILRNLGKNGIMLSDARVGLSEIYNNTISNTGRQLVPDENQGTGIAIGGYTVASVRDNKVDSTWLWGIACFAPQDITITGNSISRSGINDLGRLSWPTPIMVRDAVKQTVCGNLAADGLMLEGNQACSTTKTFLRKGYWVIDGKRLYWKAYKDQGSPTGYTLESGDYAWYKE